MTARIALALAVALTAACRADPPSETPLARTRAWCAKVDALWSGLPDSLALLRDDLERAKDPSAPPRIDWFDPRTVSPEVMCELTRREMAAAIGGFGAGAEPPDDASARAFAVAAHGLEDALMAALGPGCARARGGSPDAAIEQAREAIARARDAVTTCGR